MNIPRRKPYFHTKVIDKIIDLTVRSDETKKLERDLKTFLRLPNAVVLGQGRVALRLILKASGMPKGSEIIIPGYTFGTLAKIIKDTGYIPKPVDIDYNTYQISIKATKKAINKKTKAILATHLFGQSSDIKAFQKIAKSKNLLLIEDCAQSLGTTLNKKLLGTFGDVAFSSFDLSKPLQGIRGGVLFGNNVKLIKAIKKIIPTQKNTNFSDFKDLSKAIFSYVLIHTPIWFLMMFLFGYKKWQKIFVETYRHGEDDKLFYHMPPIFARIVRMNIPSFPHRLEKRRKIRELYFSILKKELKFQHLQKHNLGSFYMILAHVTCDIFALRRHLALKGIDIALADEIADNCLKSKNSQVSLAIKDSIALPVYESLKEEDVRRVGREIKNFLNLTAN